MVYITEEFKCLNVFNLEVTRVLCALYSLCSTSINCFYREISSCNIPRQRVAKEGLSHSDLVFAR